jgi:ketosteroid isomerase-like protein
MRIRQGVRTKTAAMIAACLTLAVMSFTRSEAGARQTNANTAGSSRAEIDAFNKKYIAAHLRMDNAAVKSMWAEDGISLLPTTDPIIGRMPGYHMQKMDVDFQGIEVSGDWASEWAEEHQVVQPPPGKRVIDSYGKLLLVLHREADGNWRISREMWNQGLKP